MTLVRFSPGYRPTPPGRPRVMLTDALRAGVGPAAVNYGSALPTIGMHLNDEWGCCVEAADANCVEQQSFFGQGTETVVPDTDVLIAYEAVGGFNPNAGPPGSNPTDQGSLIPDGLQYLKLTGMTGVKIAGYGQIDVSVTAKLQTAVYEFGGISIGINLPNSAIQQFNANQPWDVVANDGGNAGGHCVYVCGYDANGFLLWTWDKLWHMSYAFWDKYVEEAWGIVSQMWVSAITGKDPEGVDLVTLGQEFLAVTGQNPFPAPSPEPPAPVPAPPSPPQPPQPAPPPPAPAPQPSGCMSLIARLRYGPS